MGGEHARVGHDLAPAALQLRPPARDPLGASAVRPPPRRSGALRTAGQVRGDAFVTASGHALTTEHSPVAGLAHDGLRGWIRIDGRNAQDPAPQDKEGRDEQEAPPGNGMKCWHVCTLPQT